MRVPRFHLSIPCTDLAATERWYVQGLGCVAGRRSEHALILDLGGHQLVAQKTPPPLGPPQRGIYPRHFGLVYDDFATWDALRRRAEQAALRFGVEPRCRYPGQALEHHSFFLIDPDHHWLEFKHYRLPEAVLGCHHLDQVGDAELRGAEPGTPEPQG
ncbi:MAG: VOC family protein [Synechococcaceae cyanobacterium]|nr:VOC family protein [Synechococcaceae cyanobacterium]